MKFKILGIYLIISLFYGENLLASVRDMAAQYESKLQDQEKKHSSIKNNSRKQRFTELERETRDVNVLNRVEIFENSGNRKRAKKPVFSEETSALSDSQETLVSEETDSEQFENLSSDWRKITKNLESRFSESQHKIEQFEQKISDLSDELDSSTDFAEQRGHAESIKKDMTNWNNQLVEQIDDLKRIQEDFEALEISNKIKQLNGYRVKLGNMSMNVTRKISQIQTNQRKQEKAQKKEQKRLAQQQIPSINWSAIREYNEKNLSLFVKAVQNHKLRFSVIQRYGQQCFDDQDISSLFDPNQKMDPSLKGLCKQIYQVRFPEAVQVWSKIKKMKATDPEYSETLETLRTKIKALSKNVSSLIKQGYKEKKASTSSQN